MPAACAYVAVALTSDVEAAVPNAHTSLTGAESSRWAQLRRASDRADFVAARALTRLLLTVTFGSQASGWSWTQVCPTCAGAHGRPHLTRGTDDGTCPAQVSWAHTEGVVAAAVAPVAIGVDVEWVRSTPPPVAAWGTHSVPEQWIGWTRAEALVKHGQGLVGPGCATDLGIDAALALPLPGPVADGEPLRVRSEVTTQPVTDFTLTLRGRTLTATVATGAPVRVVPWQRLT